MQPRLPFGLSRSKPGQPKPKAATGSPHTKHGPAISSCCPCIDWQWAQSCTTFPTAAEPRQRFGRAHCPLRQSKCWGVLLAVCTIVPSSLRDASHPKSFVRLCAKSLVAHLPHLSTFSTCDLDLLNKSPCVWHAQTKLTLPTSWHRRPDWRQSKRGACPPSPVSGWIFHSPSRTKWTNWRRAPFEAKTEVSSPRRMLAVRFP